MMKRTICTFLCAAFLLSLSACGVSASVPTPEPDPRAVLQSACDTLQNAEAADSSTSAQIVLSFSGKEVVYDIQDQTLYTGTGTDDFAFSHSETLMVDGSPTVEVDIRYIDGVCYISDTNGRYKAPMTVAEFEDYLDENLIIMNYDVAALTAVSFAASGSAAPGSVAPTSIPTSTISYTGVGSELLPGLTALFDDTLTLDEASSSLRGAAVISSDGIPISDAYTLTCSGTYSDLPVKLELRVITASDTSSAEEVTKPEALADYGTVSDIRIPSEFLSLYPRLAAESALSFSVGSEWIFTVSEDSDTYKSYYEGTIIYNDALSFVLKNTGNLNDYTWSSDETYADGVLSGVYDGVSESVSEYTDSDFTTTLLTIYYAYPISWENVKNVTMTEQQGVATFDFDYTDEYVNLVVSNCYAYLYDFDDLTAYATSANITGAHATVTANLETGELLNHAFTISASYNINGLVLDVSADFELNVTAVGDNVVIPGIDGSAG